MSESTASFFYRMHWYKEIHGKDERRRRYRILREAGLPVEMARSLRDWSDGHLELFLKGNPHLLTVEPEEVIRAIKEGRE